MDLQARVRRLEWWNRLLVLCVAGTVTLGFTSQVAPARRNVEKILRAERLEVVDHQGRPRVVLGLDEQGAAGVMVNDTTGEARVTLLHDAEGSALFIRDAEGVIRVGVAQFAHGGGGVALHGPNSRGAAVLYFQEAGSLTFYDLDGEPTMRIPEKQSD